MDIVICFILLQYLIQGRDIMAVHSESGSQEKKSGNGLNELLICIAENMQNNIKIIYYSLQEYYIWDGLLSSKNGFPLFFLYQLIWDGDLVWIPILWDYTNIVMNFLSGSSEVDGSKSFAWLQYFDVVITGSAKPGFFHEKNHPNLFGVVPETEMLLNTDSVLYVGDHIYGAILRSKKVLGWRTMLVIPELEKEVQLLRESRDTRKELQFLRSERDRIEDEIHHL
ncbi:hypothetical protein AHAS_Ahas03G0341700 [Arachis hypogaea]